MSENIQPSSDDKQIVESLTKGEFLERPLEIKNKELLKMSDLDNSEKFILWCLAIPTLFFGFYPEPLINTIEISIKDFIEMYNFNLNMNITKVKD